MKQTLLGLGILILVVTGSAIYPHIASAYRGDPSVQGPNYTEERHEAMIKAIQNNNIEEVKALMQGKGVAKKLGDDAAKWARFVEAQRLMQENKFEEAKQIKNELGLGLKNGSGRAQGQRMGCGSTNR